MSEQERGQEIMDFVEPADSPDNGQVATILDHYQKRIRNQVLSAIQNEVIIIESLL